MSKSSRLIIGGAVLALVGAVWGLQGLGYLSGSAMTGSTVWAIVGPLVAIAGLAMLALGLRSRSRGHRRIGASRGAREDRVT